MDAHDWFSSLLSPVLVVGNGPLSRDVPDLSMDAASVVRFNNFRLCPEAGFRVTHWVSAAYREIRDRPFDVAFSPWTADYPAAFQSRRFAKRTRTEVLFAADNDHILQWFPDAAIGGHYMPTTGFCFLSLLWRAGRTIMLRGFDHFSTGHYWDADRDLAHHHTKKTEREIIREHCPDYRQGE